MYAFDMKEQHVRDKNLLSALQNFAQKEYAFSILTERSIKNEPKEIYSIVQKRHIIKSK